MDGTPAVSNLCTLALPATRSLPETAKARAAGLAAAADQSGSEPPGMSSRGCGASQLAGSSLTQMPSGSRWEVVLPPEQAYGNTPQSPIGPNQAVVFDVQLVGVK